MVTYNDDTHTATGSAADETLRGRPGHPWTLVGGDGDDVYQLRSAEYVQRIDLPGSVRYERYIGVDRAVERPGGGTDTVVIGPGFSSILASALQNIERIEVAEGRTGPISIVSNDLPNWISGGPGNDAIRGEGGADTITGGDGNDKLSGGSGNDRLSGQDGDDRIDGGSGTDTLYGNGGNDTLVMNGASDRLYGGTGSDTISYEVWSSAVGVDLSRMTSSAGGKLSSFEGVIGGKGADTLAGSKGANLISGGAGGDRLTGLGGTDTLDGGKGSDYLDGGSGNDTLSGGSGNDRLFGGSGNDRLVSDGGRDVLTGGSGADTFEFHFSARYRPDGIYVAYDRTVYLQDTIADFVDGEDRISIVAATSVAAGVHGSKVQVAPDEHSIYLENPDNGYLLPLDTPRRGIDPSPWAGSSSVIVHFGPPDGSAHERGLGDLYFGSVTIVGATIGDITTSDFMFG